MMPSHSKGLGVNDLDAFLDVLIPTTDGVLDLRALPGKNQAFCAAGDRDAVAAFLVAHAKQNVYLGVATRRDSTNGALENCRALHTPFVDVDFKTVVESQARARLNAFPLPPTLVVQSGGGLHVYWQLKEPIDLSIDTPACLRPAHPLAAYFDGDVSRQSPRAYCACPDSQPPS